MGMIGYDMRVKRIAGKTFCGKFLSILGSGLKQVCLGWSSICALWL